MPQLYTHEATITGKRTNNQDSMLVLNMGQDCFLLAIADGMGGSVGGEIASRSVIDRAKKISMEIYNRNKKHMLDKSTVLKIFEESQKAINDKIDADPALTGMGTTLVCVLLVDDKYIVGNIGDSRAYIFSDQTIHQITKDHTYLEDYKDKFGMEINQDISRKYSHYLVRSVNGGKDIPDVFPENGDYFTIGEGDGLILCSDGLIVNKADTDEQFIRDALMEQNTLESASARMIKYASEQGSTDNITVVLGRYQ